MRKSIMLVAAAVVACGGGRAGGGPAVTPVGSSAQAMREFMRAAADSNLARMAELWGTERGSARETGSPPNYEKRLVVIQAYMRADSSRIVSDVSMAGADDRRQLQVAMYRRGCMKQVPVVVVRAGNGGWLVKDVDLASAGNPARPCEP